MIIARRFNAGYECVPYSSRVPEGRMMSHIHDDPCPIQSSLRDSSFLSPLHSPP